MKRSNIFWHTLVLQLLAAMVFCRTVQADPPDFLKAHNLQIMHCAAPDTHYEFVTSNEPGNVFYPRDAVNVTIRIAAGKPGVHFLRLSVAAIAMRRNKYFKGQGAMTFLGVPQVEFLGTRGHIDVPVAAGKKATLLQALKLPVPERFGSYVITLAPNGKNPQFLCTLIRAHPIKPGFDPDEPILSEVALITDGTGNNPALMRRGAETYARLGIKEARWEGQWYHVEGQAGVYDWTSMDQVMNTMAQAHLKALLTLDGYPQWTMPFGQPTPACIPDKPDYSCAPRYLPQLGKWIRAMCRRYWHHGHGALWILENWNEPWEGISISGWESDMPHYRAIMQEIATNARAVSPRIKTAAACSIMNTEDKFLSGKHPARQIKMVDIFTDHYVPAHTCYGPMVARYWGKESMDTETWSANNEMLLPQVMTQFMACGQKHVNPCYPLMIYFAAPGGRRTYDMPTPVAMACNTFSYFITDHPFRRMLFMHHLPWAFQFGQDPKAVVVLLGRLYSMFSDPRGILWWQFNLSRGGTMTVPNADGAIHFYNVEGNRVFAHRPTVTLPVNYLAYYLTCPQGGVKMIRRRLAAARYHGVRPVEIIAHNFTQLINSPGLQLHTTLHNLLPQAVHGTLTITSPAGLHLAQNTMDVTLQPGASLPLTVAVTQARVSPSNSYLFKYKFQGPQGHASWAEVLHVLVAREKTIKMDGKIRAWKNIPGVLVASAAQKVDFTQRAWLPFMKQAAAHPSASFAQVKLAWDHQYLYLLARVHNPAAYAGHIRLATRDDNQYFRSAKDDAICESLRPFKKLVLTQAGQWRTLGRLKKTPAWKVYQRFLATHPQAQAELYAAAVFFTARKTHPKASFAQANYVYKTDPSADFPWSGDNFQFAFHVLPGYNARDMTLDTSRVPAGFHAMPDSDYEYALYACTGGGSELWCLLAPGMPREDYYPRQPQAKIHQGPVAHSVHIVRQDGDTTIYEAAIPWTQLSHWAPKPGSTFGFTFQVNNNGGSAMVFGEDMSATKDNGLTLHPYWAVSPSCTVRWGLTP